MRHKPNIMERKVRLKTVNPFITCYLCEGYLVDSTTITECLHTFCKSCIVKYLQKETCCPKCGILIHQSHPLNYISHDRTMQDIVYKLVPGLSEKEQKDKESFYKSRGLDMPRHIAANDVDIPKHSQQGLPSPDPAACDYHRNDEQVNVCLQCHSNKLKPLHRRFIRCSSHATISHLKKFIALKLYSNTQKCQDVDILCREELLGKDHTLKFICMTRWRAKDVPLELQYRPKMEL